jgi:hypothetical protein
MATYHYDFFPKKLLNKWIGEDVQDDPKQGPVYTVSFYVERPDKAGIASFSYVAYEDPPWMDFYPKVDPSAFIEDPIALKLSDEVHPYHYAAPNKVFRAMIKALFGEEEVKVIR